jgi:hypothetical protein
MKTKRRQFLFNIIPSAFWNRTSAILAAISSKPTIGTPIYFEYRGFVLVEIDLLALDDKRLLDFTSFCYPSSDFKDVEKEIETDRINNWPYARTFIVAQMDTGRICGCIQVIEKADKNLLPVECAQTATGAFRDKDLTALFSKATKVAEIARCRKNIKGMKADDSKIVLMLLFKAVWSAVVQNSISHTVLSFDKKEKGLRALYVERLGFSPTEVDLRYFDNTKTFELLTMDSMEHERFFAARNGESFALATFCRWNLKPNRLNLSKNK